MIGAGLSYYRNAKQAENYLLGNAQAFDGSFDYDDIVAFGGIQRNNPVSYLYAFKNDSPLTRRTLLYLQGGAIYSLVNRTGSLPFVSLHYIAPGGTQMVRRVFYDASGSVCVCFVYLGDSDADNIRVYINGVEEPGVTALNTLAVDVSTVGVGRIGQGVGSLFDGLIKQVEIVNLAVTPSQAIAATASGSFRGAGIEHGSGNYLFAVDFEKTDGQDPTTFAGTPSYTINAVGGSTYQEYL